MITFEHRLWIERLTSTPASAAGPWEVRHTWKRDGKKGRELEIFHFASEQEARAKIDQIRRFFCAS